MAGESFVAVAYNALAQPRTAHVTVPVPSAQYAVFDPSVGSIADSISLLP